MYNLHIHFLEHCDGECSSPWLHSVSECSDNCKYIDNGGFCWHHGNQGQTLFQRSYRAKYPYPQEHEARESTKSLIASGYGPQQVKANESRRETTQGQFNLGNVEQSESVSTGRR